MCTIVDEEDAPVGSGVGRVSRSRTASVFEARVFSGVPFFFPVLSCCAFTLSAESRAEILLGHLIYGLDAPAATEFIVGQTGF